MREPPRAFGDAGFDAGCGVELFRLFPKGTRFVDGAGYALQDCHAANGVCHIEWGGFRMCAVEAKSLAVAGLGELWFVCMAIDIAEMTDRVGESERIVEVTVEFHSFFVMSASGFVVVQLAFDFGEGAQSGAESWPVVFLAQ